jgi:hypothetical protein
MLKSQNLGRVSEKCVQITGQLYQPYEFQLNVKNHFPTDINFTVSIISIPSKTLYKGLYCLTPLSKIKKDETAAIIFVFMPFLL